ncbi:hypothetical protein OCK74_20755 [Chitinophagaceae bacterium LB-8]|jgi:hypothetical protein|uniref:Uncharacterized protein n=1 Tax=Paraflavisolibacter caeni TaxID=2982496 RepID=A0A9X2XPR0_9BACT|nr:hypothetical protein [Paraflavisolibacter caeni]MCU7551564.1 hypothetical protein [Paraflavisolibacter caeni]
MKTTIEKKSSEYVRIENDSAPRKNTTMEASNDKPDMEVQIIQMGPSFLGMPGWKFFVVKDKK